MWRRIIFVVAVLAGALFGLVFALKSPRVAHNLKQRIEQLAAAQLGLRVEIDELALELMPPAARVRGVRVYRPERAEPWVTLYRGRVEVQPWPSTAGALVIEHLELDGLDAEIDFDLPAAASGQGVRIGEGEKLPLDVRRLLVWSSNVVLESGDYRLELERADFEMLPEPHGGRRIDVDLPIARASLGATSHALEARLRARLRGSLDRPESITLDSGRIFLEQIALKAEGHLALQDQSTPTGIDVTGVMPLERLRELEPRLPDMAGEARFEARLEGELGRPTVRLDVEVAAARLFAESLGDVSFEGVLARDHIGIESFRISQAGSGAVTGSGALALADGGSLSLSARAHAVSLPAILAKVGLPDSWVRLLISGDLEAQGRLSPLDVAVQTELEAAQLQVLDRSYRATDARELFGMPEARVTGRVHVGPRSVTLSDVVVQRAESTVRTEGTLSYDLSVGLDLRAVGEAVRLEDVGPIAGTSYAGRGGVAVTIEGPYEDIGISGTGEIAGLTIDGWYVGDTKATMIYGGRVLGLDRATVRRGRDAATATGEISFVGEPSTLEAIVDLDGIDAREILVSAGMPARHARRFAGDVTGRVTVGGPLTEPHGRANLASPDLRIDGVPFGRMQLEAAFGGDAGNWLDTRLENEASRIDSRIEMTRAAPGAPLQYDIAVATKGVPLVSLRSFIGGIPVSGSLSGEAKLHGPLGALSGSLSASIGELEAYGLRLGSPLLHGRAEAGRVKLEGTTLDGRGVLDTTFDLGERMPYTATVSYRALPVGRIWNLPDGWSIDATGTMFSQGDMTRGESISADWIVEDGTVLFRGLSLRPVRPLRVQYANGNYDIHDMRLAGSGAQVSIGGRIPVDGDLALSAVAQGDLGVAASLSSAIESARGPFELRVAIAGSFADTTLTGEGQLRGGRVRLRGFEQSFDNVSAKLFFGGRDVVIQGGTASAGAGSLRFGGDLRFPSGERTEYNLRAAFTDVTSRPAADMTANMSGDLSLTGPAGDLLLRGDVRVHSLRYVKNLELDITSLLPRRDAPLQVPTLSENESVALSVRVQAPNNVLLSGNQLEAELRADVVVTGTSERVGLIGSVTPLWARARWRDIEFDVQRASIDFVEEYRIVAQFDVTAAAEACGMKLNVTARGDSDRGPLIVASGKDDHGPVDPLDALSCIQLGVRARALSAADSPGLSDAQWGALDALAQVSGVDRQLRRLFPIEVDEVRLTSGRSAKSKRTTPRIVVSKDIGAHVELSYNGSLNEPNDHVVSLEYEMSKGATLEGSWVSVSDVPVGDFGIDLRLRWEFQ